MVLMVNARSLFRDLESYLRIIVGIDEDDIWLILKQFMSFLPNYEILPGICSVKGVSEAFCTMGDHKGTLNIVYDDISLDQNLF